MKHIFLLSFLLILCLTTKAQSNKDEVILRHNERVWLEAEFRADTATIAKFMDDDFIAVNLNSIGTKKDELEGIHRNITQRVKDGNIVESFKFEDFKVQFHNDIAIVTFICVSKGQNKGVAFNDRRTRIYDVWKKTNGKWKAISSQVTPIKLN